MYLIGDKDYHQSAFAIIDVEAEVRSHARLRVDHLQMKEDKKRDREHRQEKQTNKQKQNKQKRTNKRTEKKKQKKIKTKQTST